MITIPPDLKSRYSEGRLIPFIGAGISMAVTWQSEGIMRRGPSWRELVDQAATMLGFQDPDLLRVRGNDLQILEFFRIKRNNEMAEIKNWFNREVNAPDAALEKSEIHAALANMTNCNLFYTTNYDDFLERGLRLHGRQCASIATEGDIASFLARLALDELHEAEVVKFHGDLNNPGRMVLSESDYEQRLRFSGVEDQRLKSDLLGRALLFLGYSFRDWNVSYLFRLFNEDFGRLPVAPTGRRAYIAVADPSDFEYKLFQARNIEVVAISTANREQDIAELLGRLAE
jgi:hypothetical protein